MIASSNAPSDRMAARGIVRTHRCHSQTYAIATEIAAALQPINKREPEYTPTMAAVVNRKPARFALPARSRNAPGTRNAASTEGVAAKDVAASFV